MTAKYIRSSCGRCERVFETVRDTTEFKYNCNLVLIDFFVRHGLLSADDPTVHVPIVSGPQEGVHSAQRHRLERRRVATNTWPAHLILRKVAPLMPRSHLLVSFRPSPCRREHFLIRPGTPWAPRPGPCREPRLVSGAEAAGHGLLVLQRHRQRNRRRLPPDPGLPQRRRPVVCSAQRPLGAGAAARRAEATRTRRPLAHLRQQKRHDLLLSGRLAQDLKGTQKVPDLVATSSPRGGAMRLSAVWFHGAIDALHR